MNSEMDNVIHADFNQEKDNSGYTMTDADNGQKRVTGVYVGDLAAIKEGDEVYLGEKIEQGISYPVVTTIEEMNQFCIMWLCIFQPEVIVEDKP